ncbi:MULTISPECIES: LacI family DNA-binding transcriptional regulator [Arthrobacter]|uniref:LacI family transcriptional regulator n=1 Tax=Arthrobacter terricola TaxID=2547396 RepID=A0A4R5K5L6_9MICC|nr:MULTISPECIES: LacI family DNA-binding transcriptional regulator [Arthrobacter]MBT8163715.1 LacI family transcriptional regulator [Arthrobacter sp. GN70]TDF87347.1 LacI family transcriptional regulator [Arthrobacter terricola]
MKTTRARSITQEDVAREVGVSRTLVSFAFRGAPGVSDETKQAIFDAAKLLGYSHNAAAADLARKQPATVGLFLLDLSNEVYVDVFSGVREAISPMKKRLILSVSHSRGSIDEGSLSSLIEARVGVIIAATLLEPDSQVQELSRTVPLISVTRRVEGVDSVYSNNVAGARAAVEHLLRLGHTRIAHVTGPIHQGHEDRRLTYEEVIHKAGLVPQVVYAQDYTQEAARQAADQLFGALDRPTAVFAHNDEMALGVREIAFVHGLEVPRDLSLVGYDDSRIAKLHGIDLTSVDLHALELGRTAGITALERLAKPDFPVIDRKLEPRLMVRSSTAAPAR